MSKKEIIELAVLCGMPERFIDVSKKDFNKIELEIVEKIINSFIEKVPNNYFYLMYGNTGSGKSRIGALIFISCIYKAINKESNRFSWQSLVLLSDKIKSTYDQFSFADERTEIEVINRYCYFPVLLVFEFGDIKQEGNIYGGDKSPHITQLFHKIIDYRWRKRKRTLFITPLGAKQDLHKQLIRHYDNATIGRLLEDAQLIKHTGKDRRIEKAKQRTIWEI